ncbi:hypothetical protein D3C77_664760 [compost metagenome]
MNVDVALLGLLASCRTSNTFRVSIKVGFQEVLDRLLRYLPFRDVVPELSLVLLNLREIAEVDVHVLIFLRVPWWGILLLC